MKQLLCLLFAMILTVHSFAANSLKFSAVLSSPASRLSTVKMIDHFTGMDLGTLHSNDEQKTSDYLITKNQEMLAYLKENYRNDGIESLDTRDVDFTTFALLFSLAEGNNFEPTGESLQMPAWVACAGGVIGATFGVWGIVDEIGAVISGGGSFTTAWSLVKKILKRYAGWIGVAFAIYEIVDNCF